MLFMTGSNNMMELPRQLPNLKLMMNTWRKPKITTSDLELVIKIPVKTLKKPVSSYKSIIAVMSIQIFPFNEVL